MKELDYDKDILPYFLTVTYGYGLTADFINWSCPSELKPYEEAYLMRRKQTDTDMYMQGLYFREAIVSTVGNMFGKKGAKPYEYPKQTFYETMEENRAKNKPLTEEEKKRQTELLFKKLSLMKANFELTNGKNKKKDASQ